MLSRLAVVILIAFSTRAVAKDTVPRPGWKPADPAIECTDVPAKTLCAELLALRDKDQIPRHRLIETPNDPQLLAELERVDAENLARVVAIIEEHEWPRKSQVGERAAGAAWLIIQHADLATQERFIDMMKAAVEAGELDPSLIALTVDRIRVGHGKPQLYGTQFKEVDGVLVMEPLEDPENVDQRRASVGLPSLAEYEALIREYYAAKPKPSEQPSSQEAQ